MIRFRTFWVLVAACLLGGRCVEMRAQETAPTPATVEEALKQMSDVAGVVFVGEVTRVESKPARNGGSGVVEVDFHVNKAVRGCVAGRTYTLKEWAGLWPAGEQRYRVGQQLLMLLHAPGAGGFSSPVGGMAGAIPVRGTSDAPGMASSSTASSPAIADLRWVGTRVLRVVQVAPPGMVTGASDVNGAGDVSVAAQQAPVDEVVEMLRGWGQGGSAAAQQGSLQAGR